jgi:uncharacterized protein
MKESQYNIWVERANIFYVFNGLSGILLSLSREEFESLRRFLAGENDFVPNLLLRLTQGRMLILDDEDELETLETIYQNSRFNTSKFYLRIVTSLGCNFDCPYCFEAKHPSIMDGEVQESIIAVLDDQIPKIKRFDVGWFGGEPLVGKKSLLALSDTFIERCDRADVFYDAHIFTNGYLLDEDTCRQLQDRRVTTAQVTLDGPPEIHNRMRPLSNGKGSFWQIIKNLHHAVNYLGVQLRVSIDTENFRNVETLFQILAKEGLSGKLTVYPARLFGADNGVSSPAATYQSRCFTLSEYARAELEFNTLAFQYGLAQPELPEPIATPCTAVRANELIVGSKGELYKCPINIGNKMEVIGDIRDYQNHNGRVHKWLKYDPFSDAECRTCIALPGCMGGCAHDAMSRKLYDNRCSTFRHTYREQIMTSIDRGGQANFMATSVPVKITRQKYS